MFTHLEMSLHRETSTRVTEEQDDGNRHKFKVHMPSYHPATEFKVESQECDMEFGFSQISHGNSCRPFGLPRDFEHLEGQRDFFQSL